MTESTAKKCQSSTKDRPVPKDKAQPKLRDIPTSDFYFSDRLLSNYIVQQVRDKTFDGTNYRELPPNEVDVLALNEIAVSEGEGFFFFLPNRSSWSRQTYEPRSRGPTTEDLSSFLPSMVYIRHTWSQQGQLNYLQSPHRTRYLTADFQLNPPPDPTPLYCIQVVSGPRYPIYSTPHNSYIILRSNPLYFGRAQDIEKVIGRPKRLPKGPEAKQRLAQVQGIWQEHETHTQLVPFLCLDLKTLYKSIVTACRPFNSSCSMTSKELLNILPRPSSPEVGLEIGQHYLPVRSRFGGRMNRKSHAETHETNPTGSSSA